MNLRPSHRRSGLLAGATVLALGGLLGLAPASHAAPSSTHTVSAGTITPAASYNISAWSTSRCNDVNWFCLYYYTGATGAGYGYPHADANIHDLDNYTYPSNDGSGSGQVVGNNADSADNASNCNVGIWYSANFTGDSNWLSPWMGGNLTSGLKNNERSIAVDDSSSCPGTGIG